MITWQSCFIVRVEGCASIAYFQCDNGECISLFHVCDGKAHCLDASDERNCTSVTMGVNSLPKTVTRQRRDCDLNPGPSTPESSTLTTRLPSHRHYDTVLICSAPVSVCQRAYLQNYMLSLYQTFRVCHLWSWFGPVFTAKSAVHVCLVYLTYSFACIICVRSSH